MKSDDFENGAERVRDELHAIVDRVVGIRRELSEGPE